MTEDKKPFPIRAEPRNGIEMASGSRRKRSKISLAKSGMQKGALDKYFVKRPKEECEEVPEKRTKSDTPVVVINYDDDDGEVMIIDEIPRERNIEVVDISGPDECIQIDSDEEDLAVIPISNGQVSKALQNLIKGRSNIIPDIKAVINISSDEEEVEVEVLNNREEVAVNKSATVTESTLVENNENGKNPQHSVIHCVEANVFENMESNVNPGETSSNEITSAFDDSAIVAVLKSSSVFANTDEVISTVDNEPLELEPSLVVEDTSTDVEPVIELHKYQEQQPLNPISPNCANNCSRVVQTIEQVDSLKDESVADNVSSSHQINSTLDEEKNPISDEMKNDENHNENEMDTFLSALSLERTNGSVSVPMEVNKINISAPNFFKSTNVNFSSESEDEDESNLEILLGVEYMDENIEPAEPGKNVASMEDETTKNQNSQNEISFEDSELPLHYISDLECRLNSTTPLKNNTNTTPHILGPQKKLEKAIWRVREGTPELNSENDNENSENEPKFPIILNAYSLQTHLVATIKESFSQDSNSSPVAPPSSNNEEPALSHSQQQQPKESFNPTPNVAVSKNTRTKPVVVKNDIADLMDKRIWKKVAFVLQSALEDSKEVFLPKANIALARLTVAALLNPKERIAKEVKINVTEVWKRIFEQHPISRQTRNFYNDVLNEIEKLLSEDNESLVEIAPVGYSKLFQYIVAQVVYETPKPPNNGSSATNSRSSTPVLGFLELITDFFIKEYQGPYLSQTVRRNRPKIVELLNSNTVKYNQQLQYLIKQLFSLVEFPEPFYIILKWVSLLGNFFTNHSQSPSDPITIVNDFCSYLKDPDIEKYQLNIIERISQNTVPSVPNSPNSHNPIKNNDFRERICFEMLRDFVYFTEPLSTVQRDNSLEMENQIKIVLLKFYKTLLPGINYEDLFTEVVEEPTMDSLNNYGEGALHKLVKSEKGSKLREHFKYIIMHKSAVSLNPRDAGNNTPLHDAVEKGWNIYFMFYEYDVNSFGKGHLPMINLMAKNHKGDTPLHIAASSGHVDVVESLLIWAKQYKIQDALKLSRNNENRTPYDMSADLEIRSYLKLPELNFVNGLAPTSRVKVMTKLRFVELLKMWHRYYSEGFKSKNSISEPGES